MIDLAAANHTGRELELMLKGSKPLAMFYAEAGELPNETFIPEESFAQWVAEGRFVRAELSLEDQEIHPKLGRKPVWRYVFFASKEEQWRISAMSLLLRARQKGGGWNESCERVECALLGYTEEETDAWCAHVYGGTT